MPQLIKTRILIQGNPLWVEIEPHGNFDAAYWQMVVEEFFKYLTKDNTVTGPH